MLENELRYFIKNQKELVEKYNGKVLILIGENVADVYDTVLEAFVEAQKKHKLGTFMIQECKPGPSAYTVEVNHQRVTFA